MGLPANPLEQSGGFFFFTGRGHPRKGAVLHPSSKTGLEEAPTRTRWTGCVEPSQGGASPEGVPGVQVFPPASERARGRVSHEHLKGWTRCSGVSGFRCPSCRLCRVSRTSLAGILMPTWRIEHLSGMDRSGPPGGGGHEDDMTPGRSARQTGRCWRDTRPGNRWEDPWKRRGDFTTRTDPPGLHTAAHPPALTLHPHTAVRGPALSEAEPW